MGRNKKPIEVIKAEGKCHLTKKQIQEREDGELKVPFTDVKPPSYLNSKQKRKFKNIAEMLLALNILTELDVDCLALYIVSLDLYLTYTEELTKIIPKNDMKALKDLQNLQDKTLRQCLSCAKELGLTITSRAKLVIPTPPEQNEELW